MKRFITICSVFLFLSFSINTIRVFGASKSFTQGLYLVKDVGLTLNSTYEVRNLSSRSPFVLLIFDENNAMQEFIRLESNSPKYFVKPLGYEYVFVIIGKGEVEFT